MSQNKDVLIQSGRDIAKEPKEGTTAPDGRSAAAQPRWRKDFPIDWRQDEYVSRRELTKFVVLTSFAFVVGQIWVIIQQITRSGEKKFTAASVAKIDELPIGGSKSFQFPAGSSARLLVRLEENEFVAYDQACTHLMCPVVPQVETGKLHCPCHNGWFDIKTGAVLAGPPERPLPRVVLEIRGDEVWATAIEERS